MAFAIPLDPTAATDLAAQGLEYRTLDHDDRDAVHGWIEADFRGFHHARPTDAERDHDLRVLADRLVHGVYDPDVTDPAVPVATVSAWPTGLSVPGGRSVDA